MTRPHRRLRARRSSDRTISDEQVLDRLRSLDASASDPAQVAASRATVWSRLADDHPSLRSAPIEQTAPPLRLVPPAQPAGGRTLRSRTGGWRTMFDVAAAAVIAGALLLGSQGFSFLPEDSGQNPLATQSVSAATPPNPTATIAADSTRPAAIVIAATPAGARPVGTAPAARLASHP